MADVIQIGTVSSGPESGAGGDSGSSVYPFLAKTNAKKHSKNVVDIILSSIQADPRISVPLIAQKTSLSTGGVQWYIRKLRAQNIIKHVGPAKGGHWEIITKQEDGQDSD